MWPVGRVFIAFTMPWVQALVLAMVTQDYSSSTQEAGESKVQGHFQVHIKKTQDTYHLVDTLKDVGLCPWLWGSISKPGNIVPDWGRAGRVEDMDQAVNDNVDGESLGHTLLAQPWEGNLPMAAWPRSLGNSRLQDEGVLPAVHYSIPIITLCCQKSLQSMDPPARAPRCLC